MEFVVRRLRPDEGQLLRDIRLRALADAPLAFLSTYDVEAAWADEVWDDRARRWSNGVTEATFVAEADGGPFVGVIGAFLEDGGETALLVSMWTAPDARRRGVARALVEAVVDWSRAAGATDLHLWVAPANEPAIRLYQTVGFQALPEFRPRPDDPCREELRMSRPLAGSAAPAAAQGAHDGGDDGDDDGHPQ